MEISKTNRSGQITMQTIDISLFDGSIDEPECEKDGFHLLALRQVIHNYDNFNDYLNGLKDTGAKLYLYSFNQLKHIIRFAIGHDINKYRS